MHIRKPFAALIIALLAVPSWGQAAPRTTSLGDVTLRELIKAADRAGITEEAALSSLQTIEFVRADGSTGTRTLTARAVIERFRSVPVSSQSAGPGLVDGVPEVLAGNLAHAYISFTGRLGYSVHRSTVVPATPGAVVSDPVTGLPLLTEYGGPLLQVKGSGWAVGLHSAGYAPGGANVDLAEGGPYAGPAAAGFVSDSSMDFAGHGSVEQVCVTIPFVGCILSFGLLLGDGVAVFDSSLPAGLPLIP